MKKLLAFSLAVLLVFAVATSATALPDTVSAATGSSGGSTSGGSTSGGSTSGGSTSGGSTTTVTLPNAPTNLSIPAGTVAGETQVKLQWTDKSSNETGFRLERALLGSATWTIVKKTAKNITSYTDSGLSAGKTYYYRVAAYNSKGSSVYATLTVNTVAAITQVPAPAPILTTPSNWAKAEIASAIEANLTTDEILGDYNKPITREEFCELVIKLYEGSTGLTAVPATVNPFTDTTNTEILKAYQLGIIKGVSDTKFAPSDPITRQEIAVMFTNELKAADPTEDFDVDDDGITFADQSKIASWALESIRFMNQEGIMKGIGQDFISPTNNTTREQAIALIVRTFEKFGEEN